MGYRIEYGSAKTKQPHRDKSTPWGMTLVLLLAFLLMVNSCWPRGQEVLQKLLWPGEMEQTQQALEVFITQLRYGEPVTDAVEGFCREILSHEDFR